jgi:hypothetical protein
MGLLSDEQYSALTDALTSAETVAEETPTASDPPSDVKETVDAAAPEAEEKEAPVKEAPIEAASEAKDVAPEAAAGKSEAKESSSPADGDGDDDSLVPGHRVPYKRFKQVLDARNQYRTETDGLRKQMESNGAEVEELRRQMVAFQTARPAQPAEAPEDSSNLDRELEALLAADKPDVPDVVLKQLKVMESRLHEQERQREYDRLKVELDQVTTKYTEVDQKSLRQVLLHAVSRDPNVSLTRIAEQYTSWMASMEEAAIAKYVSDNPGASKAEAANAVDPEKPGAPPRVVRAGAGKTSTTSAGTKQKYGTIKEGTDALFKAIKDGSVNLFG